jgi:hypothetical protein
MGYSPTKPRGRRRPRLSLRKTSPYKGTAYREVYCRSNLSCGPSTHEANPHEFSLSCCVLVAGLLGNLCAALEPQLRLNLKMHMLVSSLIVPQVPRPRTAIGGIGIRRNLMPRCTPANVSAFSSKSLFAASLMATVDTRKITTMLFGARMLDINWCANLRYAEVYSRRVVGSVNLLIMACRAI